MNTPIIAALFRQYPYAIRPAQSERPGKAQTGVEVQQHADGGLVRRAGWSTMAEIYGRRATTRYQPAHSVLRCSAARTICGGLRAGTGTYARNRRHDRSWFRRVVVKGALSSLLGALVVSCSGCGGGGDGGTPPAAAQATALRSVLIESYGDSTTQGWQVVNGTGTVTPNSAPAVLQKLLQDRFGTSVIVTNNGVGSTEASQLLNGTDGVHPT